MKQRLFHYCAMFVVALVFSVGIGYLFAWSGPGYTTPGSTPPNDNVPAPINVGAIDQTKTGDVCTSKGGTTKCLSVGSGVKAYSTSLSTVSSVQNYATWTDKSLSITLTPTSANSKFLITAFLFVGGGGSSGNCSVGLFKNSTVLIAPYASAEYNSDEVAPTNVTYIDLAGDISPRTYKVMIKNLCSINSDSSGLHPAVSTMSIFEIL